MALRMPGFEPESLAWEDSMLTTAPHALTYVSKLKLVIKSELRQFIQD